MGYEESEVVANPGCAFCVATKCCGGCWYRGIQKIPGAEEKHDVLHDTSTDPGHCDYCKPVESRKCCVECWNKGYWNFFSRALPVAFRETLGSIQIVPSVHAAASIETNKKYDINPDVLKSIPSPAQTRKEHLEKVIKSISKKIREHNLDKARIVTYIPEGFLIDIQIIFENAGYSVTELQCGNDMHEIKVSW